MLSAFILNMPQKPTAEQMTEYYKAGMVTGSMKWFCKKSGKKKYTPGDIDGMKETAALRAADRNPYSWNMEFREYEDGSGYEARFTKCGILSQQVRIPAITDMSPTKPKLQEIIQVK